MNECFATPSLFVEIRSLLSLKETLVLAEIPDDSKIRKDIESGWLTRRAISTNNRLWFRWVDVILLGAVYRNNCLLGPMRKRVLEKVENVSCGDFDFRSRAINVAEMWRDWSCERKINIDNYLFLDLDKVFEDVGPRLDLYAEGLKRIEVKNDVLGGASVFRGTRLSVLHVGKMYDRGESLEDILEDYPYLNADDVKFAHIFYLAHPAVGRPRNSAETDNGAESAIR